MCAHGEAATGTGSRVERAAIQGGTLAHPGDAMSLGGAVAIAAAAPVVRDLDVKRIARPSKADLGVRAAPRA